MRRRGIALAAALVCVLLVAMFSAALINNLTLRQRSLDWDDRELQCQYLLTSAIERARTRSGAESEYRGEVWTPALDDRGFTQTGRAEIRIETVSGEPSRRRVIIETLWPDDPVQRVRRTTQFNLQLPNSGAAL